MLGFGGLSASPNYRSVEVQLDRALEPVSSPKLRLDYENDPDLVLGVWTTHSVFHEVCMEMEELLLTIRGGGYRDEGGNEVSAEVVRQKALTLARAAQLRNLGATPGSDDDVLRTLNDFYAVLVASHRLETTTDKDGKIVASPVEGTAQDACRMLRPIYSAKSSGGLFAEKVCNEPGWF